MDSNGYYTELDTGQLNLTENKRLRPLNSARSLSSPLIGMPSIKLAGTHLYICLGGKRRVYSLSVLSKNTKR